MNKLITLLVLLMIVSTAYAHQSSTSFISLQGNGDKTMAEWKVSISSVLTLLILDRNNDGNINWLEVKNQSNRFWQLLENNLVISGTNGQCLLSPPVNQSLAVEKILDKNYLLIQFSVNCTFNSIKNIDYHYFFKIDNDHKAIVSLADQDRASVHILSADNNRIQLAASSVN